MIGFNWAINFSQKIVFTFFVYFVVDDLTVFVVKEFAFEGNFFFIGRLKLKAL